MKRLVRIAERQLPPPACLAALRRLHPRLELLNLSPGVWWIGIVREGSAAEQEGVRRLVDLRRRHAAGVPIRAITYWKAELMRQGFRMLCLLETRQPTPSQCVAEVAPRLAATPVQVERALDEAIDATTGKTRREEGRKWLMDEYIPRQGLEAHRHAFTPPIYSLPPKG